jgi:lipid II:glycine glycyltransferase (peptidoglycan interpeptide bridge formation enzyme)
VSAERPDPGDLAVRRTAAELDPAWDEFAAGCPGGDLLQTTAWATTKRAIGQETSLVTLLDGPRIVGGGLIIAKRFAAGIRVGYVPRGPLFDPDRVSADQVIDGLTASARAMRVRLLIVQPPLGGEAVDRALASRGFELGGQPVAPEATIRLDLTHTDDELLAGMSSMRRRNIRKAMSSGLTVEQADEVELFQRLHAATAARQGFRPFDAASLRGQWNALAPAGLCTMFIARHAGRPVAGLWVTSFAGVVTFKFAGWDAEVDGSRNANEALHWTAIRWARTTGARQYDLGGFDRRAAELIAGGEPLPDAFSKSPSYFKLGFGGSVVMLPKARWSLLGAGRRLLRAPARWVLGSRWVGRITYRLRST